MLGVRSLLLASYRLRLERHRLHCTRIDVGGVRALVVAPHKDDETLGCGGTIAALRAAGTVVKVVCLGDGGPLRALRAAEMQDALDVLGVDRKDITFLDLPESHFDAVRVDAERAMLDVLERERPEDIFVPYRHEPHRDHAVTYEIVAAALGRATFAPVVYEYPIWFWCHWPLVASCADPTVNALATPARGVPAGIRLLRDFRHVMDVGEVLSIKRAALECYASQLRGGGSGWTTLESIAGGAWLPLLFERTELFHRSGPRRAARWLGPLREGVVPAAPVTAAAVSQ